MRKVVGLVIAASAFAGTAQAATFDPAQQGPFAANFTYGYVDANGFTAYTAANFATGSACQISTGASSSCLQGGPSNFLGAYFTPVDGQAATAFLFASDVSLHPGSGDQQAAVVFNAPTAGSYTFAGTLRAVDAAVGNGVTYTAGFSTGVLAPGGSFAFNTTQTLTAGQQVFFLVGNNGAYFNDTTGLQLTVTNAVPEPAAWAMMIGGFGAAGGALRRRRANASVRYA